MISKVVTHEDAKKIIEAAEGTVFKAIFRKRTEDEHGNRPFRRMICRKGVKKGVNGTGMPYNPEDHGLITVYDMQKKAFRMISTEGLVSMKVRGEQYRVVSDK